MKTITETRLSSFVADALLNLPEPIISSGDGWSRVNNLLIILKNGLYQVKKDGVVLTEFNKKSWATAYAIAMYKGNLTICLSLIKADLLLTKYSTDIMHYTRVYSAIVDKDLIKANILSDKISKTELDYEQLLIQNNLLIKNLLKA